MIEEHGARGDLAQHLTLIHSLMTQVAAEAWSVPPFELTIVLSGDFDASIADREVGFTPERLGGGTVGGKTTPVQRDYTVVEVFVDATTADDFDLLAWIHTVLHDYGHVFLGRLRAAAGTRPPYPTRDQTLPEIGAIWAFETADEYRCELLSDRLMKAPQKGGVVSSPDSSIIMNLELVMGDRYRYALADLLGPVVHPGWPDLVGSRLDGDIDVFDMFNRLVAETGNVLKVVGYADALERTAERGRILDFAPDHPAVVLYLGPVWSPIARLLEGGPVIPSLSDFAEVDSRLQELGQGIVDMWERLGVTGYLTDGDVSEVEPPAR